MRGEDLQQDQLFSYASMEEKIPADHPLRAIRGMVDQALKQMSGRFDAIYGEDGRKSIPRMVKKFMRRERNTSKGRPAFAEACCPSPDDFARYGNADCIQLVLATMMLRRTG